MKRTRIVWLATVLLAPVVFVSCNDGNNRRSGDSNVVPDSAGSSGKNFFDYLFSLSMSDESSEPAVINGAFAVPEDEVNDPTPLT